MDPIEWFIVEYVYPASRLGGEKNYTVAMAFNAYDRTRRYIDFGPDSRGKALDWANENCNNFFLEYGVTITRREHAKFCRLAADKVIDNEP